MLLVNSDCMAGKNLSADAAADIRCAYPAVMQGAAEVLVCGIAVKYKV